MGSREFFTKRVYEIVNEMKIPLIDERVHDKVSISSKNTVATVIFRFEEDESVLRGFVGLADYFHTVIIKQKDKFYISNKSILFRLECS
ncbi:MAG: hypothetical protein ACFFDO_07770 [Candidatus Thorarchaeota archaeon]